MLADTNDRPSTAESYAGAISEGVSRVAAHKIGRVDLVASAGMSPYRMGTALMRLVSEWASGATPPPADSPSVRELRKQGMSADLAEAESRRLASQCAKWHLHEVQLRLQRLKTLPTVRAGLLHWVNAKGWEDAEGLVAAILQHYLSPKCSKCGGSGLIVIEGTGGRSDGKRCRVDACRRSPVPGELVVPHGGKGKALLAHMRQCTGQAAADMREGTRSLRHSLAKDVERYNQRARQRTEELQRADAEARADLLDDAARVAAHFEKALGAPRRRTETK